MRGSAREVSARFSVPPKGEITIVVAGGELALPDAAETEALRAVMELVAAGVRRRTAADVVARLTGVARNTLYRGSL